MHVNERDKVLEREVASIVIEDNFPTHELRPTVDPAAAFDFEGPEMLLDVKVRDTSHDSFDAYFVSTHKVETVKESLKVCFIAYYFRDSKELRLYNLTELLPLLKLAPVTFTHKRDGLRRKQECYLVPATDYIYRCPVGEE